MTKFNIKDYFSTKLSKISDSINMYNEYVCVSYLNIFSKNIYRRIIITRDRRENIGDGHLSIITSHKMLSHFKA